MPITNGLRRAALVTVAALSAIGGLAASAHAGAVTIDFESPSEPLTGGAFGTFAAGAVMHREDGFTITAAGANGGFFVTSAYDPTVTGTNFLSINGSASAAPYAFSLTADDGSAFDLTSLGAAGMWGGAVTFRIDFERADGTTGSTATLSAVGYETLTVGLAGIVRATFVAAGAAWAQGGIDDISIQPSAAPAPVPVPGPIALLVPALIALRLARRSATI